MAPWKAAFGSREAFGAALPYARDGVRVTVFYDEIQEGTRGRPRFESVMLAHVLVHEIIQVLSTASDLEFAGVSADVYSSVDAERS